MYNKEIKPQDYLIYYSIKGAEAQHNRCKIDYSSIDLQISFNHWEQHLKDKTLFVFYDFEDIRLITDDKGFNSKNTLIKEAAKLAIKKLFHPETGEAYIETSIRYYAKEGKGLAVFANSIEEIEQEPYKTEIANIITAYKEQKEKELTQKQKQRNEYINRLFQPCNLDTSLADKHIDDILGYKNPFFERHPSGYTNITLLDIVEIAKSQESQFITLEKIIHAKILLALIVDKLNNK